MFVRHSRILSSWQPAGSVLGCRVQSFQPDLCSVVAAAALKWESCQKLEDSVTEGVGFSRGGVSLVVLGLGH